MRMSALSEPSIKRVGFLCNHLLTETRETARRRERERGREGGRERGGGGGEESAKRERERVLYTTSP